MTKARTSSRPRFFSCVRAVRCSCGALSGGKKIARHEGLGGLRQGGLVVFERHQIIGPVGHNDLRGGFLLGMHRVEADEPARQFGAPQQAANRRDFIFTAAFDRTVLRAEWLGSALHQLNAMDPSTAGYKIPSAKADRPV